MAETLDIFEALNDRRDVELPFVGSPFRHLSLNVL